MNVDTSELQREYGDQDDWPNEVNVHKYERMASTALGIGLITIGGLRRGLIGAAVSLLGAGLMHRGATGHCSLYSALRVSTAHGPRAPSASVAHGRGVKIKKTVTIRLSPSRVYRFWRALDNLPIFMHGLDSVTVLDDGRSHWCARGPAGKTVEWDAQIINDVENEVIAWRSLPDSQVHNAGSVRFERALGGHGTLVTVTMEYDPPAGLLGALAARLLGADPERQVEDDLRRLKALLESGEVPHLGAEWRGRLGEVPDLEQARELLGQDAADDVAELPVDAGVDRDVH
jgi:uncharacterized membrane protein